MHVIGLTGNFGMGKSSVLEFFGRLGAVTVKSDKIIGELLKDPKIIREVVRILGHQVKTAEQQLDKRKIAKIVFNNDRLRHKLEKLLHPIVLRKISLFVSRLKGRRGIVIVEVPLLFEGNYQKNFYKTITVFTTKKIALGRLKKAGVRASDAEARLRAQMPVREKKKLSDYVIDNNGSLQKTQRQVENIFADLLAGL